MGFNSKKQLQTQVVSAVAGEIVTTEVNWTFEANRQKMHLFIGYDATTVQAYNTTVESPYGCQSCNSTSKRVVNENLYARGVYFETGADFIKQNVKSLGHTAGISFNYSVGCDHYKWMCSHAESLAQPILYRSIVEILRYGLNNTDQISSRNIDEEKLKERIALAEALYSQRLDHVIQNIRVPNDEKCFYCRQKVRFTTNIP